MVDITMLREKKRQLNLTNAEIAALSGVPFSTVNKVLASETKNPRYETLRAIQKVLLEGENPLGCDTMREASGPVQEAPDWVVEVASGAEYDFMTKRIRYEGTGIREYWMIDPQNQKIYVYDFRDASRTRVYTFEDEIPSAVAKGVAVCLKKVE